MLNRSRHKHAYVYTPTHTKHDFEQLGVRQVLDGLLDDYQEVTISYLAAYFAKPEQRAVRESLPHMLIRQN